MTLYIATHSLHMTTALLSITFFLVRGYWMLTDNGLLQHKVTRIAPHIIDTLLLASAIGLMFIVAQYPFTDSWLTVKLFALVAYIVLGTIAIKRGKTKAQRTMALVAALLVFVYIVSVAFTKNPLGFAAGLA
jgi:uncharacterized membrane protein SirB2